eukprot:8784111-Pyramimonas_sp.AAC.1
MVSLDWANMEDASAQVRARRAWTWRHDVEFDEASIEKLMVVRADMVKYTFRKIAYLDRDDNEATIDSLLDWAAKLTTTMADGDSKKYNAKQDHLYRAVKGAVRAHQDFIKLGIDVTDRVRKDPTMAASNRLHRAADTLAKAIKAVEKLAKEWAEDEFIKNLDKELQQLMPFIGGEKVGHILECAKEHFDVVDQSMHGHPEGNGKDWLDGAPGEDKPWEEFVDHFKNTLGKTNIDQLEKALDAIEPLVEQISDIYKEFLPQNKDELAEARGAKVSAAQLTVASHRIMTALISTTDKVVLRTTLRDIAQNYMAIRKHKIITLPARMARAVTQGLKQERIKG